MPIRRKARSLAVGAARRAAQRAETRAAAPKPLAVKPKPTAVKPKAAVPRPTPALPAPEPRLALPPPDPAAQLPPYAAKPRGGQWWTENSPLPVFNPRQALEDEIYMSERFSADPVDKALLEWWDKAVPRYIQNDMATPNDPMRDLAARGMLHTDMSPDEWSQTAGAALAPISLQKLLFEEETRKRLGDQALETMPWLAKAPATDTVYGVNGPKLGALGLTHVRDELRNALRPDTSGIPADLALRPESLARMSFPQAAERVGRINQFRVKQMEEQQLAALNNPAIQTFKEYPDAGYRWAELRAPDLADELPEGYRIEEDPGAYSSSPGYRVFRGDRELGVEMDADRARQFVRNDAYKYDLQEALKYEGDTMGHCVGGYCDDVLSGRSRIFSLRDAKGQPHVTIETSPKRRVFSDIRWAVGPEQADQWLAEGVSLEEMIKRASLPDEQDIIQIKGKANRAPVDDYLPYVQDFVKSGTWGQIGDFDNTGLVKLPDGRYITRQQYDEGMGKGLRATNPGWSDDWYAGQERAYGMPATRMSDDMWSQMAPYFEGYAVGGRVERNRCFSRNPFSVR